MSKQEPSTPAEIKVAAIWAEVLSHDSIGRDDDFFEIGGDSFDATRVLARVKADLAVDVPIRVLLDYPVLRDFAARCER